MVGNIGRALTACYLVTMVGCAKGYEPPALDCPIELTRDEACASLGLYSDECPIPEWQDIVSAEQLAQCHRAIARAQTSTQLGAALYYCEAYALNPETCEGGW